MAELLKCAIRLLMCTSVDASDCGCSQLSSGSELRTSLLDQKSSTSARCPTVSSRAGEDWLGNEIS
jgi:hypothetical protein